MEYTIARPTYDWLLIMEDGDTYAVAHGRKSWIETQRIVGGSVRQAVRLTAKCRAKPTPTGWDIFKGKTALGSIRRCNDPRYDWECSNPNGEWAPTMFLEGAARGWRQVYELAEGTWVMPTAV